MKKRLQEINIGDTINSGQVFLWQKIGQKWYGIDGQNVLIINEKTKKIEKIVPNLIFSGRMIILKRSIRI